jgi:sugar phosphate isomerase/epimerase
VSSPLAGFLISSAGWQGTPHAEAIAAVRAAGFGGVEILCKPGHFEPDNQAHVEEVRSALCGWPDVVVTFHAPFHTADLGTTDPDVWESDVAQVARSLEAASTFGARSATIHTRGHGKGLDWEDGSFAAFRRALDRLMLTAVEHNMTLAVENLPPLRFTSEPRELLGLLDGYPPGLIGVCFDTGHAHNTGKLIDIAVALSPRALAMHIHDNHAEGKDEHLVPGQGTIPWSELVAALRSRGFAGRCVLEVVAKENLPLVLECMRDAIARTGLSRLTHQLQEYRAGWTIQST